MLTQIKDIDTFNYVLLSRPVLHIDYKKTERKESKFATSNPRLVTFLLTDTEQYCKQQDSYLG